MSGSDSKKSKKRKSYKSGNMGDVLGKECGDRDKNQISLDSCGEEEREEADGAPSGDEQSSQSSEEQEIFDVNPGDENKADEVQLEEGALVSAAVAAIEKEVKPPCTCDSCKNCQTSEQMKEMHFLQSYWMELRQYIRKVYRNAMEGRSSEEEQLEDAEKMTDLVHKLCVKDPHQLFQRLESQVQEFVIEAKVRQLELLHREKQTPEIAQIFLTGLLDGYEKLCLAAKQLMTLLHPLEKEHLQKFNLTWEVLNKHLYQSCVYTDPLVQNNLPVYIGQLRNLLPGKNLVYSELVHHYLAFDDEMTLIGAMWRDIETLIHEYNQEQATMKAKQRMLKEDWEMFKAQRKLIHQKMWGKTASELRDFDEHMRTLTHVGPGSPCDSSEESGSVGGYCSGCSSARECPCDDCAITHLLTCGGIITPPHSPGSGQHFGIGQKEEADFRIGGEGSEQPQELVSPSELAPSGDLAAGGVVGDNEVGTEQQVANPQQQSCECHVCTAPLMSTVDLMDSYECHSCVQQGVPLTGTSPGGNLNIHAGGFHLYPHIHGTGGGGDAGNLYPHLYNINPSLLTQLASKQSRLGVHIQDQVVCNDAVKNMMPPHLGAPVPSVAESLPPGLSIEIIHPTTVTQQQAVFTAPQPSPAPRTTMDHATAMSRTAPVTSSPSKVAATTQHKTPPPASSAASPPSKTSLAPPGVISKSASLTCREHSKITVREAAQLFHQNSTSTQTSPNKAKQQQQPQQQQVPSHQHTQHPAPVVRQKAVVQPIKRASAPNIPPTSSSTIRHSTTQTNTGHSHVHSHNHQSLPDVVKSAATSTTPHRATPAKVPAAHSCHKGLNKNAGGNAEPIKRVSCGDYESEIPELEDSSSQDDTCSERSSSTTTSTQRDSRHCDCCYCEVFGHGMPSVAPVSRNYQEMRERLRLLLTKKKAKCKSGNPTVTPVGGSSPQPGSAPVAASAAPEAGAKPVPAEPPSPSPLVKQDSVDSSTGPDKDPRDLEELLEFIEGNQATRCKDVKKAAKKARQKQKKMEEKERKDQVAAERQRLDEIQDKNPEVTITVVKTPTLAPSPIKKSPPPPAPSKKTEPPPARAKAEDQQPPQMVTIKRVIEPNGTEPTVTITLKGTTPDEDKVLFTLINGQVLPSHEKSKVSNEPTANQNSNRKTSSSNNGANVTNNSNPSSVNGSNSNNNNNNGKKKKNKGNNNIQQTNQGATISSVKITQHSISKSMQPPGSTKLTVHISNTRKPLLTAGGGKQPPVHKAANARPSSTNVPSPSPVATTTSIQVGNSYNHHPAEVNHRVAPKGKQEVVNPRSFSLDTLKLPPGITITKVDNPTPAPQRKPQNRSNEGVKSHPANTGGSPTIIATPGASGPTRLAGFGTPNVIVVDTGKMKEELHISKDDDMTNNGNKKKNKKKNKNGTNEIPVNGNISEAKSQPLSRGNLNMLSSNGGKPANIPLGKTNGSVKLQQQPPPLLAASHRTNGHFPNVGINSNLLNGPAIFKVNGSMVTIRNPAIEQTIAAGNRYPQPSIPHSRTEIVMNGDLSGKNGNVMKMGKKMPPPLMNGVAGTRGKDGVSVPNLRLSATDGSAVLRNRVISQAEYNGMNNGVPALNLSRVAVQNGRPRENGVGPASMVPPRMRPVSMVMRKLGTPVQNHHVEGPHLTSHSQALAAANEAKKKKKKKKGSGQGHADDWNLVGRRFRRGAHSAWSRISKSVFAPKDIDLDNGDIDDDERELEAFKRFCFNSVPPISKKKVNINCRVLREVLEKMDMLRFKLIGLIVTSTYSLYWKIKDTVRATLSVGVGHQLDHTGQRSVTRGDYWYNGPGTKVQIEPVTPCDILVPRQLSHMCLPKVQSRPNTGTKDHGGGRDEHPVQERRSVM
uniref:FAM193 C-terminal domain-containing protein n=1 Tax=Timema tahoe TaxID=61484 RepID=A0A7R9IB77_9NEOP|nr:unnamed protein product [Timema tahoe]